ncbi:PP2C family protein-serine/threonine phosphatase [Micromonospora craniellae]|uniref:Serine/threonine-protein phosphatase n=1 Tax=Micromonospora craniellae TaxID=2294034 RepID=A0A372G4H8_9ACTN|nr:PP2C family serine/threonine-protein phosphatase [Micromonospora craniellae]QOC92859.1 serine/threonine-protein phosphatase [Micromonospora craniellae]RFS47640.1 serine/threonine-protein phosphatase [Micromonospora craniellae]
MSRVARDEVRRFALADLTLEVAGGSVVGNRYRENYDVLHVDPALPYAVVADGMGDGEGSRRAGAAAVPTFAAQVRAGWPEVGADLLRTAAAAAQTAVREAGTERAQLTGCTLTGLVVEPAGGQGWVVQLGDSRAYRLRDDLLELVTTDHTVAWLGVLHGWYPIGSAAAARARYQLTRYAGHPAAPEADLLAVTLRPGDTWLLCTDGVSDQVNYHGMRDALVRPDLADAVATLLDASLDAGGADNASAVVLRARPAP